MGETGSTFSQTSFLGGEWSQFAQGRIDDPRYRTALSLSNNGVPVEEGAWTRRSGRRRLGGTSFNASGIVRTFWLPNHLPAIMELTYAEDKAKSYLRFWTQQYAGVQADDLMLLCDNYKKIVSISTGTPAVLTIDSVPPTGMNGAVGWQNHDVIQIFMDPTQPLINGAAYFNRQFEILIDPLLVDVLWSPNTVIHPGLGGTRNLDPNTILLPNQIFQSPSTEFTLVLQEDNNLVLYQNYGLADQSVIWASGTVASGANSLHMQADGNLVLYHDTTPVWSTGTSGHPGAVLAIQNDGNIVIYGPVASPVDFQLYDAVTGQPVDGSDIGAAVIDYGNSFAGHVARFEMPYSSLDEVRRVRMVQTGQSAYFLSKLTKPYAVSQAIPAPTNAPSTAAPWFQVAPAQLIDGPYIDPLSGASQTGNSLGSLTVPDGDNNATFTVTDGAYTFQAHDIGRQIRIWCQPQPYQPGASYVGIDQFPRVTWQGNFWGMASNTTSTPGFDTTWYLEADFGRWGYGVITAVAGDACTVNLQNLGGFTGGLDAGTVTGNNVLPDGSHASVTVIDTWQIGAYTTGQYPAIGTFYEGRLWLAGALPNRVDASMSNGGSVSGFATIPNTQDPTFYPGAAAQSNNPSLNIIQSLLGAPTWGSSQVVSGPLGSAPMPGQTTTTGQVFFSPTNSQGQVLDNHGIALITNASEQDQLTFLHPHNDGIIAGSVSGEHVIAAADRSGITPASAIIRQVTKYGSAFVEAIRVGSALVFVQAFGRRVMELVVDVFSQRFVGRHLNEYAKHLTDDGIAEIAYQEESAPIIWVATSDGGLQSCVYRRLSAFGSEPPVFTGWSRHEFEDGRYVMSLCMGANQSGNLDQLVLITTDEIPPALSPVAPA